LAPDLRRDENQPSPARAFCPVLETVNSEGRTSESRSAKGALFMKIAVRVFTMFVVFAGLALASVSSANLKTATQPSAAAVDPGPLGLPVPQCGPGVPTCNGSSTGSSLQ
jgi:hypothetical protein